MTITDDELRRRLHLLSDHARTAPSQRWETGVLGGGSHREETIDWKLATPSRRPGKVLAAGAIAACVAVTAGLWVVVSHHHGGVGVNIQAATSPPPGVAESLPPAPIPDVSSAASAWTGQEWLVWGGLQMNNDAATPNSGAAYRPKTKTWRVLPAAPIEPRSGAVSVWTGSHWIITGGIGQQGAMLATGATYDPATNTWSPIAEAPVAPGAQAAATWTGTEMIVVTGEAGSPGVGAGQGTIEEYSPTLNRWKQLLRPPGTAIFGPPSIAWSGTTLYVVRGPAGSHLSAGSSSGAPPSTGAIPDAIIGAYDVATDTWSTITVPGHTRVMPTLEWSAGHLLFLAATPVSSPLIAIEQGQNTIAPPSSGSGSYSYDPSTRDWRRLASAPGEAIAYLPSSSEHAEWTGTRALWWSGGQLGLEYDAITDNWDTFPAGNLAPRAGAVTTWTGNMLLAWGGETSPGEGGNTDTGISYTPTNP